MTSQLYEVTNGRVTLSLHPGQARAYQSKRRFVIMLAGTQGGKTTLLPWWLRREMDTCGPGDYLAVTATYDLFKLKFEPEMRRVFCDVLNWGTYAAGTRTITSHDGLTRIILRSANAPGGLESATAKGAVLDEAGMDEFGLGAWEAVQRRLSLSQGRVFAGTTLYNLGWVKTELYDRWVAGDPDIDVVQFESIVNPAFPRVEYERAQAHLPAWKFNMFYRGLFDRPAGMIYDCYIPEVHRVADFPLSQEWPRYVGIDFGAVHNALVWLAWDADKDAYYIYRESMEGGLTTAEHVQKALTQAHYERVVRWAGGAMSEVQQRTDWSAAGMPMSAPPFDDVEAGIQRVYALFKARKLFVFESCRGTLDQLGTYRRELDNRGQVTEKIYNKASYHYLDALRYAVLGAQTDSAIQYDERAKRPSLWNSGEREERQSRWR